MTIEISAPSLLVAMPSLQDPNFERAVVLLVEYSLKGAMGFVVNRPINNKLCDLVNLKDIEIPSDICVWYGGPVDTTTGLILHNQKNIAGDVHLSDGIFVSSSEMTLRRMIEFNRTTPSSHSSVWRGGADPKAILSLHSYRFIVGYSGWGPKQLDEELRLGAWMLIPASHTLLYETSWQNIWDVAIASLGIDPIHLVSVAQPYLN